MLAVPDKALMHKILKTLNEAQARWFVAFEAISIGRGGTRVMQKLTGMSKQRIAKGINELRSKRQLSRWSRVRSSGGGRKRVEAIDPTFTEALEKILEETTAGDPMTHLRWTSKSTSRIADELTVAGHSVSQRTVYQRLVDLGYSLQLNSKNKEGTAPPERDAQFRRINSLVNKALERDEPVISVDTKKKERIGEFKNNGREWRKQGLPRKVNVYDYPSLSLGTAIPYGTYDVARNEGFVNVGTTFNTAEFAVQSIRQWWQMQGRLHYQYAKHWLICADGGGANGSRSRSWKLYLQNLADEIGVSISVCHYPPGTSKWNKIEHRLFSYISINWRGKPLVDYETVVNLIGTTTTQKGLAVKAKLDKKLYEKGKKVSKQEMNDLNIKYDDKFPQWNYTISPRSPKKSTNTKKRSEKR